MFTVRIFMALVVTGLMVGSEKLSGQCNLTPLPSVSYQTGNCGAFQFQSLTGSLHGAYGQCGSFFFSPPLSGGDVVTSLPDIPTSPSIRIFPNPTNNGCFLEIKGIDGTYIKLKNAMGMDLGIFPNQAFLDMSHLGPGMYLLEVTAGNHSILHVEKIIKL
ncbi:MAG: T9SS type A sorting domain-containing protein [Saprospiraceae bacterium]